MKETERIADQLTRSIEGNAWHGLSVMELLNNVSHAQAAAKPIDAHSIWEIINHLIAWMNAAEKRLNNQKADLTDEEDWPPVTNISEASWKKTLDELNNSFKDLRKKILLFNDSDLEKKAPAGDGQTFYILLHGIVQHNLYHAGQIAIIKKY